MSPNSKLITFELRAKGIATPLRALLDTGASNNFVRRAALKGYRASSNGYDSSDEQLCIRLANGSTIRVPKKTVPLHLSYETFSAEDDFLSLDLDDRFDIILGMPWLIKHQPQIDWDKQSVKVLSRPRVDEQVFWVNASVVSPEEQEYSVSKTESDGPIEETHEYIESRSEVLIEDPSSVEVDRIKDNKVVFYSNKSSDYIKSKTCGKQVKLKNTDSIESKTCEKQVKIKDTDSIESKTCEKQVDTKSTDFIESKTCEKQVIIDNPPNNALELIKLPVMEPEEFQEMFSRNEIEQVCFITREADDQNSTENLFSTSTLDPEVLDEKTRIERYESQGWDALTDSPYYKLLREFEDVFPEELPPELPKDKGVQHEIDLMPGTKYCVTRQWPLPREQVAAIDKFFEERRIAGHVRESKSPHCSPTFCVKKATGGWRIVHAFNKLNDATIPAQTPIPRKDVIIDSMAGSTVFSTIDLRDGFYQILMREQDVPLTAVSTPSGMLWEWLVMPQGLSNAPATFNRCVTHLLRPVREFAPTYFDDVYIHSRASDSKSDIEMHKIHLRKLLVLMREHKLFANICKCIFGAPEIPVLGCFVGRNGVRPDPEKIIALVRWPTPQNQKDLRKFLGLSTYLHKYSENYASLIRPMSGLLKKDCIWAWTPECQSAFDSVKQSLTEAPVLAIANYGKPFHVVCDASDYAIGCALMQHDDKNAERVVSYQSRQLKPAERNYPVHDKELLAMKYALTKFRVHLLGDKHFTVFTDHCSLRTAIKSPHLSQRMARWLSFFAEFNFTVEYKPGKLNVIADALSRRPDYESNHRSTTDQVNAITVTASSTLLDNIKLAYTKDSQAKALLSYLSSPTSNLEASLPASTRSRVNRFRLIDGLLLYSNGDRDFSRVFVSHDEDLKFQILYEYHDSPTSGHLGREKTYLSVSRDFYWPRQYKWVRKYVRACEICQRVKPSASKQAPLRPLPIPTDCWKSVSMDYVFGLPPDLRNRTGILVIVDRFSKMVHLTPVPANVDAEQSARIFIDTVFRLHGMPESIVSDRDPRFTSRLWQEIFSLVGTKLKMSTADHPETDGQTERVNRVVEDILRSYAHSFTHWSDFLPLAEFAVNNAVHASTGHTPFYINGLRHPRIPAILSGDVSHLSGGGTHHVPIHVESTSSAKKLPLHSKAKVHQPKPMLSEKKEETIRDRKSLRRSSRLSNKEAHICANMNVDITFDKDSFLSKRQAVVRFVRDAIALAIDKQKEQADKKGRKNKNIFTVGSLVLLSTALLPTHAISNLGSNKLLPRYIGPFKVLKKKGDAYTIDLPTSMRTHPTFYVGRLKEYIRYSPSSSRLLARDVAPSPGEACDPSQASHAQSREEKTPLSPSRIPRTYVQGTRPDLPSPRVEVLEQGCSSLPSVPHSAYDSSRSRNDRERSENRAEQKAKVGRKSLLPRGNPAPPPPPSLRNSRNEECWIVEKILSHRYSRMSHRGHTSVPTSRHQRGNPVRQPNKKAKGKDKAPSSEYLVRWLGFSPEFDSWEPYETLIQDVPDLVRKFHTWKAGIPASKHNELSSGKIPEE